jgi:hypothetical protein
MVELDDLHQHLQDNIAAAQNHYQKSVDNKCIPQPDFRIGDKVFIKVEHFRTTHPSKKLFERYLSPYEIITKAGSHSFTLRLPDNMHAVHPVFHVSTLEPAVLNTIPNCEQPPPPPVIIDGELEYEISEILDSKLDK